MTYYYDSEAKVMIAVDPDTEDVRVLEAINFEEDEPDLKPVKVKPAPQSAKRPGQGCPECGSKSRHRKECSKAGSKTDNSEKVKISKMSASDFDVVKEQQRDGMTTAYVAKRFDLDPQEVVDACASVDYRTYKVL
jgi:hypothetical protein